MPERYTFDLDQDVILASLDEEIACGSASRFIDATFSRMSEELRLTVQMLSMVHPYPFFTRYGAAHYFEGMTRQLEKDGFGEVIERIDSGLFEYDSLENAEARGVPINSLALGKLKGTGPGMVVYVQFGVHHLPSQAEKAVSSYYSGGLYVFGVLMSTYESIKLRRELGV